MDADHPRGRDGMTTRTGAHLALSSPDLADGTTLPTTHADTSAGGSNQAPALAWKPVPGAQSYAVTCYDPDAPTGSGVWHWVLADIPPDVELIRADDASLGRTFVNDLGVRAYSGAAPPPGRTHRYEFRVYALAVPRLPIPDDSPNAIARFTIYTHTIDTDVITVTFPGEPT